MLSVCSLAKSQNTKTVLPYIVENGDTIFYIHIKELRVFEKPKITKKRDWKKYYRMVYNLPRVYPYAEIAKNKLAEMNAHFVNLKTKRQRKEYIKTVEREMMSEFKAPLKKLSRSQGRMLIKLFNRETGSTAYALVKEMKGGFSAFFWQGVAALFGASLKATYNEDGDDAMLEDLVKIYESGDYDALYYQVFGMDVENHTKYLLRKKMKK